MTTIEHCLTLACRAYFFSGIDTSMLLPPDITGFLFTTEASPVQTQENLPSPAKMTLFSATKSKAVTDTNNNNQNQALVIADKGYTTIDLHGGTLQTAGLILAIFVILVLFAILMKQFIKYKKQAQPIRAAQRLQRYEVDNIYKAQATPMQSLSSRQHLVAALQPIAHAMGRPRFEEVNGHTAEAQVPPANERIYPWTPRTETS